MKIVKVTNDLQRDPILHFNDETTVWFLRPEFNQNQPGPGVEPPVACEKASQYLDMAYEWLRHNQRLEPTPESGALGLATQTK